MRNQMLYIFFYTDKQNFILFMSNYMTWTIYLELVYDNPESIYSNWTVGKW